MLGEIEFKDASEKTGICNADEAVKVAKLLQVDEKKFSWSLVNYCLVKNNVALKKTHSCEEAKRARNVLVNNLYTRLVDYTIGVVNHKLSFGRAIL